MEKYLLLCIIWFSQLFANLIYPPDESKFNSIHLMFKWETVEHATEYEFELSSSSDFYTRLISDRVYDTQYLVTDKISWESTYYWRVRTVGAPWHDTYSFTTSSTRPTVTVIMHDPSQYAEGNTIFGIGDGYYSAVIDKDGNEIWNSGSDSIIYYNFLDDGRFYGARYEPDLDNYLPSVKFSLTDGIEWETPNDLNDLFTMHEFIELPWGDYMGIVQHKENGPIFATSEMLNTYLALGYVADGVTNEFPWLGHRLVIWDKDTEEVVWSWSSFDGFSMLDYDITETEWGTVEPLINDHFDWTHINAFYFDERDNSIYISTRNLSRITKLQYPSGDIIWNMGHESASGEVTFGHDLDFSYQHSISLTDEDNILIFDNGNYSDEFWGQDSTSRALEISVSETGGEYSADIAWQYILPVDLYGSESGNVQKLLNGNYLITTVGNNGTTLEITPSGDPVWEANYGTNFIYRASRIPLCLKKIGQINGDGGFNVQDVILLVNCILVEDCDELDHPCTADLNGDGGFNVADVVLLVQCILQDNCNDIY